MNSRPRLLGLHHVAIIASDIEASKRFYVDFLGFELKSENYLENRKSWKVDLRSPCGVEIELFSFSGAPPRPSYPEALGLRHLALRVEDIEAWVTFLAGEGIECEALRIDPYTGARFTFLSDPDDLPIELYQIENADT